MPFAIASLSKEPQAGAKGGMAIKVSIIATLYARVKIEHSSALQNRSSISSAIAPVLTLRVPELGMYYFTDVGRPFGMETVISYMYMFDRRVQYTSWRHSTVVARHLIRCNIFQSESPGISHNYLIPAFMVPYYTNGTTPV